MNLKYIKILTVALLVLIFVANNVYSGPRSKLGTCAAPELLIPVGSIGTSLGGSNLSSVSGIDAMFWNPAGICNITSKNGEALFSHENYVADIKMEYLAGVVKLGNIGYLGASVRSLNIGEIQATTELQPDGTGEIFKPTYLIANLGLARQMTDKIRFGTNIKVISENMANLSSTGVAFDFGIQYIGGLTGFSFGIAIKNLGPQMTFTGPGLDRVFINENGLKTTERVTLEGYDLPTNLELGVAYGFNFNKQHNIILSGAFQNSGFSSDEYKFGLEYNWNNYLFIRGAYNIFPDKNSDEALFGPTFGAGVRYPLGNITIGFDYAYRIVSEKAFNTNQFFTLNVGF
jgi:hypothetical protein